MLTEFLSDLEDLVDIRVFPVHILDILIFLYIFFILFLHIYIYIYVYIYIYASRKTKNIIFYDIILVLYNSEGDYFSFFFIHPGGPLW
jgi:hypothetical protein